jgi:hypothetical protein
MIMGTNRVFAHAGREFHLQIEDLGGEHAAFEVRVYDHGALLWRKRVPYDDVLARGLPKAELEEALQTLMDKTLITVEAAIAKGRLG